MSSFTVSRPRWCLALRLKIAGSNNLPSSRIHQTTGKSTERYTALSRVGSRVVSFQGKKTQKKSLFQRKSWQPITSQYILVRHTQRIVSVNYLFGRPLIPYDFLKGIFTSNFRDMRNLTPSVFGLIKTVVSGTENRSAKNFGKEITPKVFGKLTKMP